jgi:cobalamin biosynthesis protein CobW
MQPSARIPVLVVSGFLGSGKTSLVRALLEASRTAGQRVAVVSNELGALGIDRALIGAGPIRELEGGCVCCELSEDLVRTLEALRGEVAPDRIVIETSGVALPYDVQLALWRPPVATWVGDDMGVVVVNAEQLAERRDLGPTFEQQVSAADLLVLNQIDRVEEALLPELEARLAELEPEVPLVRALHGRVDPVLLAPPDSGRARGARPAAALAHVHEPFETEVMDVEAGIDPAVLVARLRGLGALRAKGWVETAAGPTLVQGVGRRVELTPGSPPDPERAGRLVVIRRAGASSRPPGGLG